MKIDVGLPITALCGAELRDNQGNVLTLQKVIFEALTNLHLNYETIVLQEKLGRYNVAKKIFECKRVNNVVELSAQEINVIKVLIGYLWPPIIVGRSIDVLDEYLMEDMRLQQIINANIEKAKPIVIEEAPKE